jgi:hypothetical protein
MSTAHFRTTFGYCGQWHLAVGLTNLAGVADVSDRRGIELECEIPTRSLGWSRASSGSWCDWSRSGAANRIDDGVLFRAENGLDCQQVQVDFPVRTAAPTGKRPVIVNAGNTWGLTAGGWKKCDTILGCNPPADHCDQAWIAQAEFSAVAEYPGTTRACDQNWLIHDLQRHSGQVAHRVAYR